MSTLELIDESFDKDCCENYELSIQTSLNGFSFVVKDTVRNSFIVLVSALFPITISNHDEDWQAATTSLFDAYPWLKNHFKKVFFRYLNAPYTVVPSNIFDESNAMQMLSLTHDVPNLYELHFQNFSASEDGVVIFAVPTMLASYWVSVHSKTVFVAPIAQFNTKTVSLVNKSLLIESVEQNLYIAYVESDSVVAVNTFPYKDVADVAYFALGFCKSLGIDSQLVSVKLIGDFQEVESFVDMLKCYFAQVSTDILFNNSLFTYRLIKYRAKYFGLFNQQLQCE